MTQAQTSAAAVDEEASAAAEETVPPREWPEGVQPEIIVFACHYCAYAAADLAGSMRLQYPPTIRIIKLPCTGKLEVIHVLKALEAGADGVYAAGCMEGECHYLKGNLWARRRIDYVKRLLEEMGFEPGASRCTTSHRRWVPASRRSPPSSPNASGRSAPVRCAAKTSHRSRRLTPPWRVSAASRSRRAPHQTPR